MKKLSIGLAGGLLAVSLACSGVAMASTSEQTVHLTLNGVNMDGKTTVVEVNDRTFMSVQDFANFYHVTYNTDHLVASVNGNTVGTEYGMPFVHQGQLYASVRALVESYGGNHSEIGWDNNSQTVNVTILPDGTVKLTPVVPMMGEHWAKPTDMPLGPIYGLYNGKLIFLEYMPAKDLDNTVLDVPGNTVPIPPIINHMDIDWNPNGHEGYLVPHYDLHLYFISRDEQNNIK